MPILLDGTATAKTIRAEIAADARRLTEETGVVPTLAAILAGDDPASQTYVQMKERACARAGIGRARSPSATTRPVAKSRTAWRAERRPVRPWHLIQHPLPKHMDEPAILSQLSTRPRTWTASRRSRWAGWSPGCTGFHSCTPAGMIELMKRYGLPIAGKHAVVIGRSVILGKPLALLLLAENATVTVCHSRTENLAEITRQADILCACIGRAEMITADMVKPGAVVLDAGYNRVPGRSHDVGDVDFDAARPKSRRPSRRYRVASAR